MTPSGPPASHDRDGAAVVVVGGGHAGGTLVGMLRQAGHAGPVVLVGHEVDPPYHRPPLSKTFSEGELEQWLRPIEFYEEQGIILRLGTEVLEIDRDGRTVRLSDGTTLEYSTLVLATGAEPRRLRVPGAGLRGVIALRDLPDARVLRDAIASRGPLAIVGAGYVGLEVAAVGRSLGVDVTVIERENRVLARVASPELSEILTAHHRRHGASILLGADVTGFSGTDDGRVAGVELADGTTVPCATALVGVGAIPRDAIARAAGLECDGGIVVDHHTRTADPHILAIGDVTRRPIGVGGTSMRMESIPSATEQAKQAAAVITGADVPSSDVPWFWSDQFDLKLKIAGLLGADGTAVVRGDPARGKFAVFHLDDGVITAVESANAGGDFMAGKKFIALGRRVDPSKLADADVPLRDVVV